MPSETEDVIHDPEHHQFRLDAGSGEEAVLRYRERSDGTLDLVSTFTPTSARGRGLAARLVEAALDFARAQGKRVIPSCWYVAKWMDENPGYDDLRA